MRTFIPLPLLILVPFTSIAGPSLFEGGPCVPPSIVSEPPSTIEVCQASSTALTVQAEGTDLHYQWYLDVQPVGADANTLIVGPMPPFTYTYRCIITNDCGGTATGFIEVHFIATPNPQIGESGGVLTCFGPGVSYQWYLNGDLIDGATSNTYTPTESGTYTVSQSNGTCVGVSDPFDFVVTGIATGAERVINLIQAPGSDALTITGTLGGEMIEVFDLTGAKVQASPAQGDRTTLLLASFENGIYLVRISGHVWRVLR